MNRKNLVKMVIPLLIVLVIVFGGMAIVKVSLAAQRVALSEAAGTGEPGQFRVMTVVNNVDKVSVKLVYDVVTDTCHIVVMTTLGTAMSAIAPASCTAAMSHKAGMP